MSKKDYIKFAAMIKDRQEYLTYFLTDPSLQPDVKLRAEGQQAETVYYARNTADIFAADNPNFDRSRFLKACGVE